MRDPEPGKDACQTGAMICLPLVGFDSVISHPPSGRATDRALWPAMSVSGDGGIIDFASCMMSDESMVEASFEKACCSVATPAVKKIRVAETKSARRRRVAFV
mmetsp:Transcript_15718/g.29782  ORF Transcript_15718/g.29782 Transcript_15718/m.29782 type:complete len:103 (+) Transcript_15718:91-399(+)